MPSTQTRAIRSTLLLTCALLAACGRGAGPSGSAAGSAVGTAHAGSQPLYTRTEVMVPMRDGVRLQTVIVTPTAHRGPLPILLLRTPYGVPGEKDLPTSADHIVFNDYAYTELAADGYIFVFQNIRGRFKSEGRFVMNASPDPTNPNAPDESRDGYDAIDWLVKNAPDNNGRVGIFGTSYDGFTAAICLLHPHPALKAVSEGAAPVDEWMNDDFHHFGALRESYTFEYSVMEEADKNQNTHFGFDRYDTYEWYLRVGPLANINARYAHGALPYWNLIVAHPDYDAFWQGAAWANQLHAASVPTLNVAGFWDQEDPWGPWQIFRHAAEADPGHDNFMVAGPWYHGQWDMAQPGDHIGPLGFGGHRTGAEFRADIRAAFFRYYLHGQGAKPTWQATTFQTGSNTWKQYGQWPPAAARPTRLYLHADGSLSFEAPGSPGAGGKPYREYVSDPENPVPYRARPISPTYPGGDWPTWETDDQRFVDHRTDVLSWVSEPLGRDLTVTGPLAAKLIASTSGTDSDFIVKLIDVWPDDAQKAEWNPDHGPKPGAYARSLNGYELPIAMEVRRGRYLSSYTSPRPLTAAKPLTWEIPLRDHDHVFGKGHRIMVQVQSTWFPLIDRNPQKFVPSIYQAGAADYVRSTQRIYAAPGMASYLELPIVSDPGSARQ